ncbi:hypothetical protein BDF14DRAFT_1789317 [Spinellus fusiger]|nr:hypothetical protein BDF14DRAFT_1789317 [Spinellus fusiger]
MMHVILLSLKMSLERLPFKLASFVMASILSEETSDISYRVCKICLERDEARSMISPCQCKGSMKYIHPACMASWRKSLLESGRDADLYHCQLCKCKLHVKHRRPWAAFFHHRVTRVVMTLLLLAVLLILSGAVMKGCIHLSVILSNYPGGLVKSWSLHTMADMFYKSSRSSLFTVFSSAAPADLRVVYSPFPVCFRTSPSNDHTLFSNNALNFFLFPFSDERLWQLVLCRLEHFHLGFFLLGSVNNILLTYRVLDDMFDIVLLGVREEHQQEQNETPVLEQDTPRAADTVITPAAVMAADNDDDNDNEENTLPVTSHRVGKLIKGMLLFYCCSLVVLFWVHFNVFAFHTDKSEPQMSTSQQFVAELPLWTLRWVTLGIAVGDFALRGIYEWLGRVTHCITEEEVLTLPNNVRN